jgi:archaellum component FlaF (FlaF/FlaG flagellin family)
MKDVKMWMLIAAVSGFLLGSGSLVSAKAKPDVIIESFSAPATATQSETISHKINIVVKNISGSQAKDFIVAVILKGTVVNPGWPTQYHVLGFGTVASLKAGQSIPVTLQSFSVGTIVPPNKYEICAIADEGKKVDESDENNNWSKCQSIDIKP